MQIDNKITDEKLVILITEKDKEFFSYIIDRYEKKLRAYINRLINHPDEAQDLVQQTFMNAYIHLNSFDRQKKFSSWIYRIAHNLAVTWLKKKKVQISIDANDNLINELTSNENIFRQVINKEKIEIFNIALNKLPKKFKEPIILKYFEDKNYQEISDILRKPKNTIGTMISRAKKQLKKELIKMKI